MLPSLLAKDIQEGAWPRLSVLALGPKNAGGHSKRCLCAVQVMRKYDELFEEQA
jgi:hypothetical protein